MQEKIKTTTQQKDILSSHVAIKRIIACAGSGKTFVITRSITDILRKGLCGPEEILAITFTRNAAENMRQRVKEMLNKKIDYDALNIFTFNSFGNLIISENSFAMGLGNDYRLINISKSWQILYSIIKKMSFSNIIIGKDTGKFINDVLQYIHDLKSNLISAEDLKNYNSKRLEIISGFSSSAICRQEIEIASYQEDIAMIYEEYENIKNSSNLVDYHDHIFKPYKLLSGSSHICNKYKKRYRYIFIDEFQDTDVAQAYLVSMIYDPGYSNLTVVGDDDQGIYSFRGACVENILDFHKWDCFNKSDVKDFYLTTNFRSGERIVKAIDSIISSNQTRFEKKLGHLPDKKHSDVFFSHFSTNEEEVENITENIKILLSCGMKLKDIAIISRRKNFKSITDALERNRLKYELISSRGFFYEPEILFIISWLMLIQDILNEQHLIYILQSDKYAISDRDIFFLKSSFYIKKESHAKKENEKGNILKENKQNIGNSQNYLIDAVLNYKNNSSISRKCAERISGFIEDLNFYISQASLLKLSGLINLIFENSGLASELKADFRKISKHKLRNIETLIKISADFEFDQSGDTMEGFMLYLKDVAKTEEEDPETLEFSQSNSIKIMSIHASKGLEFEAVFMPALSKKDYLGRSPSRKFKLPSLLRKDKSVYKDIKRFSSLQGFNQKLKEFNIEEERRIFYVGCSRAGKYLFLSASDITKKSGAKKNETQLADALPFLKDIALNGRVTLLNEGGLDYLKEFFGCKDEVFFKSFQNYIEDLDKSKRYLKDFQATENKNKNSNFFNYEKTGDFEVVLSEIINSISSGKLELKDRQNTLAANFPLLYKKFSMGFKSAARYEKKYLEIIKKSKNYKTTLQTSRSLTTKKHFSLTELLLYLDCPSYYKWRFLYNIPEHLNRWADTGLRVHRHIQALTLIRYRDIVNNHFPPGPGYTEEMYLDMIKNEEEEGTYKLVHNFYKSRIFNFPDISQIITEQLFYWNLQGFVISCKADRLDIIKDGFLRIIDYKTSASNNLKKNDSHINQLKAYTCAVSGIYKTNIENISSYLLYLKDSHIHENIFTHYELSIFSQLIIKSIENISRHKFEAEIKEACKKNCCYYNLCN